jgi:hypothetical protein
VTLVRINSNLRPGQNPGFFLVFSFESSTYSVLEAPKTEAMESDYDVADAAPFSL